MAILENIRKRTTVLILIIGMALFAFVISGVFTNSDFSGGKVGSSLVEVNDETISIDEFRERVEQASRQYPPNYSTTQLVNTVYDREVRKAILGQQFEDLGIAIESDQIIDFVKTSGYAQIPDFQDENGEFNVQIFKNAIANWQINDPFRYEAWLQDENNIMQSAKEKLYFNLVQAGVGTTLMEGEFDYHLANDKVDLQYVRVPYTSIPDSTMEVSKDEIAAYIKENEDDYKQERARDIRFVFFDEKPSLEDENAVKAELLGLLEDKVSKGSDSTYVEKQFKGTDDIAAFLDNNSDEKFDTIYKAKKALSAVAADSILALADGEVYGPYRDGDFFKVSRVMGRKPNGSVKASHILFAYEGATRAKPEVKRTKEEAEQEANRIFVEALAAGADFTALARDNSDGPSAPRGGDLGYFQEGVMADAFNEFCFSNDIGKIGLVETEFGFHIIKIDDKEDVVQVANLSRQIEASENTINTLYTDATKFEMAAVEAGPEAFEDIAKESEHVVRPVNKIKEMDENLPGLSSQRAIVQWTFNEDTEVGDIKRFDLANGYAVVQLTKKHKEGLMAVEDASATALPKIRKEKKAEQIMAANQGKSLEDLAKDNNVTVSTASALNRKSPTIPGAGKEALVVGNAFALDEGQSSGLIKGESGVFMIKVTKKEEAIALSNYATFMKALTGSNRVGVNTSVYDALKEDADIEDNRSTFY